MLSSVERLAFVALVLVCATLAARGARRIVAAVRSGRDANRSDHLVGRFARALVDIGLQRPMFKARPLVSTLHAFIYAPQPFFPLSRTIGGALIWIKRSKPGPAC